MEQIEINKKFADFIRETNPKANSRVVFGGQSGFIVSPQHGEYIFLQMEFSKEGWATKNKCLAYVNFHDMHG